MGGSLDWNDVRVFLAVVEERGLAKAAVVLGVDKTTVGRRLASLEGQLRVALFARGAGGVTLTAAGRQVLEAAERMREAAVDLAAHAASEHGALTGLVRVATTHSLARTFVISAIADLRERQPGIQIVLSAGWRRADLRGGEADIAVRLVRPTDPRLACRKLGEFAFQLYASRRWVERNGAPASLGRLPVVVYDESVRGTARPMFSEVDVSTAQIAVQTNSGDALVDAVAAGLGIAELPSYVGEAHPELVRILPDHEKRYAVWLVVPQARRRVAVVREVCDAITARFDARKPKRMPVRAGRSPRTARRPR